MVTVEQTEKTETGLDVVVKSDNGKIIAWCYSLSSAQMIANALNNVWQDVDGSFRCSGCLPAVDT